MVDERIHIWNIFHDGSITVAKSEDAALTIFVSVPYLRRRLSPIGDSFVVRLSGVSLCEFHHFDGEVTSLAEALDIGEPEILSTSSEAFPITVETTLGQLVLVFKEASYGLDTGQPVTFEAIASAAEQYWREFENRRAGV